jgi:methyl-accepting chemotaxis protein
MLLLVSGSLMVACAIIMAVIMASISQEVVAQQTENFRGFSSSLASAYEGMIRGHLLAGDIYARLPMLKKMDFGEITPWLRDELKARQAADPQLANMLVVDVDLIGHYGDGATRNLSAIPDMKIAMDSRRTGIGKPVIAPSSGLPVIGINTPIIDGDEVRGTIAQTIALDKLLAMEGAAIASDQYPVVIGSDGTVLAHPDQGAIMKLNVMAQDEESAALGIGGIGAELLERERGTGGYELQGKRMIAAWSRVPSTGWVVIYVAEQKVLDDLIYGQIGQILLIASLAILFIIALSIPLVLTFTRSIGRFARQLRLIMGQSDIKGDLTQRIQVVGKDELGSMAAFFNTFIGDLEGIFATIKQSIEALRDQGVDLAANMEETSASVIQINSNIASIQSQSRHFGEEMGEMVVSIDGIGEAIRQLNLQIERQSHEISHASSTVEELLANLSSITAHIGRLGEFIRELNSTSDHGRETVAIMREAIKLVSERSSGMAETNSIIKDIASQTNLLAMNAAIEAAHAGESGKGFAVVADEIRKLAEMASQQSQEVARSLEEMGKAIAAIQESGQNTGDSLESILSIVAQVSRMEAEIRSSLDEQNTGSGEILDALKMMRAATAEVQAGSQAIAANREGLAARVGAVRDLASTIGTGLEEIAAGTGEINKAISNVDGLAQRNKEMIRSVEATIARIKTERGMEGAA